MKKFLVSLIILLTIIISMLIQVNLLNVIPLYGVTANIGIVIVVAMGLMCDKTIGLAIGSIYGLFTDALYGKSIGFYILIYMALGYFCGKIGKGFSKENKTTLTVMIAAATIAFEIVSFTMGTLIYEYDFYIMSFITFIIKETIYNIIIGKILFNVLTLLAEIINKSKDSYYLL